MQLPLPEIILIQPHDFAPHRIHPGFEPENADVLGIGAVSGGAEQIIQSSLIGVLLLAVLVDPLVDAVAEQIARQRGDGHHRQQQGMQPGQQSQVHPEADEIGENIGEGGPDRLGGGGRGLAGDEGTLHPVFKLGVQRVGKGGPGHLVGNFCHHQKPQIPPAGADDLLEIGFQSVKQEQHRAEEYNCGHQTGQRGVDLHLPQHGGNDQQLGDASARCNCGHCQAEIGNAGIVPPGQPQHVAHILQGVVCWLLRLLHKCVHLLSLP